MEIRAIVHKGRIRLPVSAGVPDGTEVRVLVDDAALVRPTNPDGPFEREAFDEVELANDLQWATGQRFR